MDVKSAVRTAIQYVSDLFETENISNLGLEEIEFDDKDKIWCVTVGFSRPWDYSAKNVIAAMNNPAGQPRRSYKVVRIKDDSSDVVSIKNYDVAA